MYLIFFFFFSSRRRHTRWTGDWSSDVCSSDLNAVQNAMVGPDTSLVGGLVAAGVLIGWHRVIDWWRLRSRRLARLIAGESIMLIHDGKLLESHCLRARVTRDELLQALREHGVGSVQDVMLAVLEPDGAISVIRNDEITPGARPHHRITAVRR